MWKIGLFSIFKHCGCFWRLNFQLRWEWMHILTVRASLRWKVLLLPSKKPPPLERCRPSHTGGEVSIKEMEFSWNNQMCRNAAIYLILLKALALFLTLSFLCSPCSRITHPVARLTASPAWWVLLSLLCWTTVTLHLMVGELLLGGQLLTQNFKNRCFCFLVQKKGLFLSSPPIILL